MNAREQNRRDFPDAAALLDLVRTMNPTARIVYAENEQGKTVGKRDPGPWISGESIVRADDFSRHHIRSVRAGKAA